MGIEGGGGVMTALFNFALCAHGTVQVKECVWLRGVACQKEREHRMAQLMWWLVVYFISTFIKVSFTAAPCSYISLCEGVDCVSVSPCVRRLLL